MIKEERAHSKYSASGFKRIAECPGSVSLSEGMPDKSSEAAKEGTQAHEVLEYILKKGKFKSQIISNEMMYYSEHAARHVLDTRYHLPGSDLMVEERVSLAFIHPEAFGSLDAAVIDHFGVLHIFDFKYGLTYVSPIENYQFIFYALAVAYMHHWNFKSVKMWTLQPRIRNFDGSYSYWEIPILKLKSYVPVFKNIIDRAIKFPRLYIEGDHCYFCKAKSVCPLKVEVRKEKSLELFRAKPIDKKSKEEDFY